ncbi:MAG: DUF3179 domain-containing protein [Thermodesulfobacteriota bacterium]
MSRSHLSKLLVVLLLLLGFSLFRGDSWDNIKLRSVPYWSYFTLRNNPLLTGSDADLHASTRDAAASRIDLAQLLSGGPPKDGIPSIDSPRFDSRESTPFPDDELILGVVVNGEAKAYPYGILNWHEIVNDTVGGLPITVTYCPLCDTGIIFERVVNGRATTFGVSGKLYQSCLVMYDRLTDSLWSQPWGTGVVGAETNSVLRRIPTYKTTLGAWLKGHPESKILSTETGYSRNYFRYPYGDYFTESTLIFPVRNVGKGQGHLKAIYYIVWAADSGTPFNSFSGRSSAFSLKEVEAGGIVNGSFSSATVTAMVDESTGAVRVFETTGDVASVKRGSVLYQNGEEVGLDNLREIPTTSSFAFVYPAFFME